MVLRFLKRIQRPSTALLVPLTLSGVLLASTPVQPTVPQRIILQAQATPDPSWQEGTVTLLTITSRAGGHSLPVRSVAFSPSGAFLASGSADRTIKIWDVAGRSLKRNISLGSVQVNSIAFSPNDQMLASGGMDGTVKLWDWQNGRLLKTLSANAGMVTAIAFSPDGQTLISCHEDKTIRVWDVNSATIQRTLPAEQWVQAIAFSPDGQTLASVGLGLTLELWDWADGDRTRPFERFEKPVYAIAFSPDGQTLAFSPDGVSPDAPVEGDRSEYNTVRLWNLEGEQLGRPLQGHQDYITSLAFSPSGQTLISGSWDRTVKVWNVQTNELVRDFSENTQRILSLAFRPDGKAFATGSGDGTVKIFISNE